MGNVYFITDNARPEPMTRIRCVNEEQELQDILEKNLDLLPGDQINPDNPRRWLLIKRETSVQDPNSGQDRWSIDFFLVDQDGVPTFVECKRFNDTRSRREVIGQLLEYAANGHYYWTAEEIQEYAGQSCEKKGISLDKALLDLGPNNKEPQEFFLRVQQNLREGQVRLVFFLEESPFELRSVVEFLNKQMERSEIIIVEARQYLANGLKVVVPVLFGYTEQARLVKKPPDDIPSNYARKRWDRKLFHEDAKNKLGDVDADVLMSFLDKCLASGFEVRWGTGGKTGAYMIYDSSVCPRSFYTVNSNGTFSINFGWLNGSEIAEAARDRLFELIDKNVGLAVKDVKSFSTYELASWRDKQTKLVDSLRDIVNKA